MSAEWMARNTRLVSGLVIVFWGLLAANTWVAAVRVGLTGSDVTFVALVLVALSATLYSGQADEHDESEGIEH